MKRMTFPVLTALAMVALLSSAALADCGKCGTDADHAGATAEKAAMKDCCIKAAKAGEGCCGKDAETVKAAYAAYTAGAKGECTTAEKAACSASCASAKTAEAKSAAATKESCEATKAAAKVAAKAEMHECCVAALDAGKGCCGKDATALKADYKTKVAHNMAAALVKAEMHECCTVALAEHKGCCGKDAEALKADYEKKVQKTAEKEMASL